MYFFHRFGKTTNKTISNVISCKIQVSDFQAITHLVTFHKKHCDVFAKKRTIYSKSIVMFFKKENGSYKEVIKNTISPGYG